MMFHMSLWHSYLDEIILVSADTDAPFKQPQTAVKFKLNQDKRIDDLCLNEDITPLRKQV